MAADYPPSWRNKTDTRHKQHTFAITLSCLTVIVPVSITFTSLAASSTPVICSSSFYTYTLPSYLFTVIFILLSCFAVIFPLSITFPFPAPLSAPPLCVQLSSLLSQPHYSQSSLYYSPASFVFLPVIFSPSLTPLFSSPIFLQLSFTFLFSLFTIIFHFTPS